MTEQTEHAANQHIASPVDDDVARIIREGEAGTGAAMRALEAVEPEYYAAAAMVSTPEAITYTTSTAL